MYDVPTDINFHKTVITGYPSGDKRMILMQMEALTGKEILSRREAVAVSSG
jgi:hypothetical protein